MRKPIVGLPAAFILTAACATTTDAPPMAGAGDCDAGAVQELVGQGVTQALGAAAMRASGADVLRWIPPNSAVTMDYRPDRLNISYDDDSVVTEIDCG